MKIKPPPLDTRIIESVVDANSAGKRLDMWLSDRFTYHSRTQWQNIIKQGHILVDGAKSRSSKSLVQGNRISFISQLDEPPVVKEFSTVFEDDCFMLINKGGNLPCHPAGPFFKNTLWYCLKEEMPEIHIINRLDRETSGLLLVAKSREAAAAFTSLFSERRVVKKYYALVFGNFDSELYADGYLMNDSSSPIRKKRMFTTSIDSHNEEESETCERAQTYLRPLWSNSAFSLVEAKPKTGRLHQIRATLYSAGFPLLGDKLYGVDDTIYLRFATDSVSETDWRNLVLKRQGLHAYALEFDHPFTGKHFEFAIPPPEDMLRVCSSFFKQ